MPKKMAGVDLKWWVIGGVGSAVIVWYVYKKQSANVTPVDTTETDMSTDPNVSGYGDYSGAYSSNYQTPSNYGYFDQATGQFIGLGGTTGVTGPSTNAAWSQQAIAYLTNQGYDPVTVTAALGKYLLGYALTQEELNIVTAAIGVEGYPPNSPPPPHLIPPTGQTGTGTQLATPVLTVTNVTKAKATLRWTPIPGATNYVLYAHVGSKANLPVGGTRNTTINVPSLHKTAYDVVATGAGHKASGHSNGVYVP